MAERIGGAELMIQPGTSHVPWFGGGRNLADRVEAFITGRRAQVVINRVLATVLFTDIVDSTVKASELGDLPWRDLLISTTASSTATSRPIGDAWSK